MVTAVLDVNTVSGKFMITKENSPLKCLVNGCTMSPCLNNGQCITSTTNCSATSCAISCICPNGTAGIYCEQQVTSCAAMSCLNGAICSINPLTNTPYCACPANTNGARYDINFNRFLFIYHE
jgi:hypothetical protein